MIDVRKEDLVVMMEAGYIYMAMRKFSEARTLFEGVSILAPKSAVPVVAAGNVYFAMRQYGRAIRTYKKALEIESDSAFAKAYLGESLLFDGRKDMAVKYLNEAIAGDQLGSTSPFAKALLNLVDKGFDPHQLMKEQGKRPPTESEKGQVT